MKTEQQIQSEILSYLKSIGAYTIKTVKSNRAGIPDIIACYQGTFFGFEVKKPGGKATPLQRLELEKIKEAKGISSIVYSTNDVEAILSDFISQTNNESDEAQNV